MRRPGADVLLAVALPVACAAALVGVHAEPAQEHRQEPVPTPLNAASLVCPGGLSDAEESLGISSLGDAQAAGDVEVGPPGSAGSFPVRSRRVSTTGADDDAVVVTAAGDVAPGLVAARSRAAPLAAVDCAPPAPDQWFTAAGAGATHDSVLELVNPNAGVAVAEVTVRGGNGVVEVPGLRGIAVPGRTSTRVDLGQVVPRRGELSLEVRTSRGRLGVHVVDALDALGAGDRSEDWLPAQDEPSSESVLLGLDRGAGERTLVLANPGADEVRATVQVITPTSVFAPEGLEPIRVAPGSTEAVSLDDELAEATADGATGLLVTATGPVTATVRQVLRGDLSLVTPAPALTAAAGAVLPRGTRRLLLGGAGGVGVATVTAYAADGAQLDQQRVELTPGAGADVTLPDEAALVELTADRTSVRAAVLLTGEGTAVVPLRQLVLSGLVAQVRPGIP